MTSQTQAAILNNHANYLKDSGRIAEAVDLCRHAVALDPENAMIHSSLCYKLLFDPRCDRAALFAEQQQWNRRHGQVPRLALQPDRSADRRLRVGYVSPDFYGHAECFFVLPLLKAHDRNEVEVHCYSSVRRPDKATQLLRSCADVWHDVQQLSDEELAEKIREDRIDVLVDLTMHMAFNRLPTFARKPAPVQVTWLAYPGGTGVEAIDYRLTDSVIDPPDNPSASAARFYSEMSVNLPNGWICYHPLGDIPPARRRDPGPVTFGCLNNPCKLNSPTLALWTELLAKVDDARLLLLCPSQWQRGHIASTFAAAGVDPMRIEFTAHRRRGDYLRLYDRIDICLDPLVYNGITTTCDALWMGVPVVTLAGPTAPGRAAASILSNLSLGELVAADKPAFLSLARDLAIDFPRRAMLRSSLRQRLERSPIMNAAIFARNVESAYRQMWRQQCV
jgi:predicted O-linked N-acetylglucosamine transferase (SPINDLY family)